MAQDKPYTPQQAREMVRNDRRGVTSGPVPPGSAGQVRKALPKVPDRPAHIKPARVQSPAGADRTPSLQETLMSRERDRQTAAAKRPSSPPPKKGLLTTLRERWAPVTKHASPSKK